MDQRSRKSPALSNELSENYTKFIIFKDIILKTNKKFTCFDCKAVENIHGGEKPPHILMLYELRSNLKFFK